MMCKRHHISREIQTLSIEDRARSRESMKGLMIHARSSPGSYRSSSKCVRQIDCAPYSDSDVLSGWSLEIRALSLFVHALIKVLSFCSAMQSPS
mmetsp:Transcript_11566/g.22259  ORF Transcript_11566/g.22259 Transcript_11566/m.22259 type:complete len:94 (-) Transcript_11566:32-313(-)